MSIGLFDSSGRASVAWQSQLASLGFLHAPKLLSHKLVESIHSIASIFLHCSITIRHSVNFIESESNLLHFLFCLFQLFLFFFSFRIEFCHASFGTIFSVWCFSVLTSTFFLTVTLRRRKVKKLGYIEIVISCALSLEKTRWLLFWSDQIKNSTSQLLIGLNLPFRPGF